jgi:hypothetical protein
MERTLRTSHGGVLAFASISLSLLEIHSIGNVSPLALLTISLIASIYFAFFLALLKEIALLETILMSVLKFVQMVLLPISRLVHV